jgi:hypothetical protein
MNALRAAAPTRDIRNRSTVACTFRLSAQQLSPEA